MSIPLLPTPPSLQGDVRPSPPSRPHNSSCDTCRSKKLKCGYSIGAPKCDRCTERGINCSHLLQDQVTERRKLRAAGFFSTSPRPSPPRFATPSSPSIISAYLLSPDDDPTTRPPSIAGHSRQLKYPSDGTRFADSSESPSENAHDDRFPVASPPALLSQGSADRRGEESSRPKKKTRLLNDGPSKVRETMPTAGHPAAITRHDGAPATSYSAVVDLTKDSPPPPVVLPMSRSSDAITSSAQGSISTPFHSASSHMLPPESAGPADPAVGRRPPPPVFLTWLQRLDRRGSLTNHVDVLQKLGLYSMSQMSQLAHMNRIGQDSVKKDAMELGMRSIDWSILLDGLEKLKTLASSWVPTRTPTDLHVWLRTLREPLHRHVPIFKALGIDDIEVVNALAAMAPRAKENMLDDAKQRGLTSFEVAILLEGLEELRPRTWRPGRPSGRGEIPI